MSLKDTLDAARREAQEAGGLFSGKSDEEKAGEASASAGFSRRSAARAKPTTEAAASVRVVTTEDAKAGKSGKRSSEMTKEERKAERKAQNDAYDRKSTVSNILLKRDEYYSRGQRLWWILLGVGFAMTVISFVMSYYVEHAAQITVNLAATLTVASVVLMVGAYVCIIVAFVYDFRKMRPIRKQVDAQVEGYTVKRLEQIIREDAMEQAEKEAQKGEK